MNYNINQYVKNQPFPCIPCSPPGPPVTQLPNDCTIPDCGMWTTQSLRSPAWRIWPLELPQLDQTEAWACPQWCSITEQPVHPQPVQIESPFALSTPIFLLSCLHRCSLCAFRSVCLGCLRLKSKHLMLPAPVLHGAMVIPVPFSFS